jgi:drug/metabolite transporter (DMT)-like permease
VAAVLASLYPVFTVLLAATLLRERIHGPQAIGLGLAVVAIAFVAAG